MIESVNFVADLRFVVENLLDKGLFCTEPFVPQLLDVPGPFYFTGPDNLPMRVYAKELVAFDPEDFAFMMRQPCTADEVFEISELAYLQPGCWVGVNGYSYWSPKRIVEWSSRIPAIALQLEVWIRDVDDEELKDRWSQYLEFIHKDLVKYLQTFLFFQRYERLPTPNEVLPTLE